MNIRTEVGMAARAMARAPAHALGVIVTLALGIGVCAAMYSIVHSVLLRALDYPQAEQLVVLRAANHATGGQPMALAGVEAESLGGIDEFAAAGWYTWGGGTVLGGPKPRLLTVFGVGGDFFGALGVAPLHGRVLRADDAAGGARAVLSHALWQELYAGDPAAIGQTLRLDWISAEIVGVMPADFGYPIRGPQLWLAQDQGRLRAVPALYQNARYFDAIARVRAGVHPKALGEVLARHSTRLAESHGAALRGWSLQATRLLDHEVGEVRALLYALLAIALLALLVACANAMNLVVLRGLARTHELGIHQALGAGREHLARAAFIETCLLGVAATVCGVLLAQLALGLLVGLDDSQLPRVEEVALDLPVLTLCAGFGMLAALFAAALPALRLRRTDALPSLRSGAAARASSLGTLGWLSPVIACAVSVGGLSAALLLLANLWQLESRPVGWEADRTLVLQLFRDPERQPGAYVRTLLERMRALPGVEAAATLSAAPLSGLGAIPVDVLVPGRAEREPLRPSVRTVAGPVQEVLGLRLEYGRWLKDSDSAGAERVALVNRRLAEVVFGDARAALGQVLAIPPFGRSGERLPFRIVGVMADARMGSLAAPPEPELWLPEAQYWTSAVALMLRSSVPPETLAQAAQHAFWELHPEQGIHATLALADLRAEELAVPRFFARNAGLFAGLALLLAAVGVHSVLAYEMARRRREFALRLALGSAPGTLARRVLAQGYALALPALACGALLGWSFARVLEGTLTAIEGGPFAAIALAGLLLLAMVALACARSVAGALRVQPMTVLRQD